MIYLMRHGRTDWNDQKRIQGEIDIPLNETGRQMARDARQKYMDIDFDVCYCSPLSRAVETAELLLDGRNIPIVPDDHLKEMSFKKYEGLTRPLDHPEVPIHMLVTRPELWEEFFIKKHPEDYSEEDIAILKVDVEEILSKEFNEEWTLMAEEAVDSGAESFRQLYERTGRFLEETLLPLHREGKRILVVAHGGVNASLLCRACGTPLKDFWDKLQHNCELTELEV